MKEHKRTKMFNNYYCKFCDVRITKREMKIFDSKICCEPCHEMQLQHKESNKFNEKLLARDRDYIEALTIQQGYDLSEGCYNYLMEKARVKK
jgi:hypothetical protein